MSTTAPAPGENDLQTLLASMNATLDPATYVWITIPPSNTLLSQIPIQLTFREKEGQTIITTKEAADEHGLEYIFPSRMVTLDVHSSLEAMGFMAKVSARLAELKMGVNPVSGYFHDHLFVPVGREGEVLECLKVMAEEAKAGKIGA